MGEKYMVHNALQFNIALLNSVVHNAPTMLHTMVHNAPSDKMINALISL